MRRYVTRFLLLLVVCAPMPGLAGQGAGTGPAALAPAANAPLLNGLDAFVAAVMEEWHVPGLALGVIQDGKPVILKGYGFRDVERKLPVTPRTIMAIGSNSKSFTVVLMGMLADSGKLDWNEPVRTYLPDFQLHDDFATREMTPRDLVTHRSGLPRHDGMWYGRSFSREELYRRLRYLEPNASFRNRYQYQNLMFMTAGYLVERLTGRPWDELIDERIFTPLGMTRSNTSVRDLATSGDVALAYVWRGAMLKPVPYRNIDAVAPAGSINSSVEEMLHYIQFHIDGGEYGGTRLLSEANATRMQTPQTVSSTEDPTYEELGYSLYGLGLGVTTYRGRKLVQHGGGIDGFISQMSWLPGERIGVMVLTNLSGNNPVPGLVTRNVFDRLLGLEEIDWVSRARDQQEEAAKRRAEQRRQQEGERMPGTSPSHDLAAYTGTYEHPGYGQLTVRSNGDRLEMLLDAFAVPLEHFHYDVFEIGESETIVPLSGRVAFRSNKKGEVDQVTLPLESNAADVVFQRVKGR